MLMGPSGNMEQDDENNWIQCTTSGNGLMGKRYPMNFQLGQGREGSHEIYPGTASTSYPTESNQRSFYSRWAEMMDAPSWDKISVAPRTKSST